MLYHKESRFHVGGLSYSLPEDICIPVRDVEYTNVNGFVYRSPDQQITVIIDTDNTDEPLEQEFNTDFFKSGLVYASEIEKIKFGEVEGIYLFCGYEVSEYLKMRICLPRPTPTEKILTVCVEVSKDTIPIKEAVRNPAVTGLIASIRRDSSAPIFLL